MPESSLVNVLHRVTRKISRSVKYLEALKTLNFVGFFAQQKPCPHPTFFVINFFEVTHPD